MTKNKVFHEVDGKRYFMGCHRDPPHADARQLLTERELRTLPSSYIIKDGTPVEDQGQLGSCTANAGDNASKIRSYVATGTFFNGSRMQLYQCALQRDGNPMQDVGSSLSTMAWVLENKGVAPESEFGYTAQLGTPVPQSVLNDALKDKTTKATRLDASNESTTIANIKAAIAPSATIPPVYPVMYGYTVFESFFNMDSSGNMPAPSGGVAGGHANVFVGYNDLHTGNYDGSTGAFLSKNSWGTGFGAGGLWWMPYTYFLNTDDGVGDAWSIITESNFPNPTPASVTFASSPATCSRDANSIDAFVVGSDKACWHSSRVGKTWSGWDSLGGICTSDPATVTRGGVIDVFTRGNDKALWWREWSGTAWSSWKSLGGKLLVGTGPSVAATSATGLDVLVIGEDDALYRKTLSGTTWSAWASVTPKIQ